MNRITIIGNLTRDPESRNTQDGKFVCNFTVAVNRRQKDTNGNSIADFFRVSAWNKMGESCSKYLTKGKKVAVSGPVSVHPFLAQDNTPKASIEVLAEDVEFLSPMNNGEQAQASETAAQPNLTVAEPSDLPF